MAFVQRLIDWTTSTFAPLGSTGLFSLAFIESGFFPIPPDVLLITLVLDNIDLWIWYALICTLGSVSGGLFGYAIGRVGEMKVLSKFVAQEKIDRVHNYFHKYDAWAIFIAAFTPIPYKVFTIAAGVFHVEIKRFVIASLIGRGARFFIVAGLVAWKGKEMVSFIDNYFEVITIIGTFVLILGYLIYIKCFKQKVKNSLLN